MVYKDWQVTKSDKDMAFDIARQFELNPITALMAVSRCLITADDIENFFSCEGESLSDPYELPDMEKAVNRINKALDNFESITIFGDYDADGVCATALLYSFLETHDANITYYIPDRQTEGYGLTIGAIEKLHEQGTQLIITVDNGISCVDEAQRAKELGIDLIVTDHHRIGKELPDAIAVINPHRDDCNLKFKELAGVGVAFKLVCALTGEDSESLLYDFADIVAVGTIGDIVPLLGENRTIVKRGLRVLNENPRAGIWALRDVSGMNETKPLDARGVAFTIVPRLNAAGRMGLAKRAAEILLCEDDEIAQGIANDINNANESRKNTEKDILEQLEKQFSENPLSRYDRILVCDGEGWHSGVIGIVASRMVERYGRPCIILSREGNVAKGSGRSIEGFSLYEAILNCSNMLLQYGGHPLAAGLSIDCDKIIEFREKINEYAARAEMPFPVQKIDLKINPKFISIEAIDGLSMFEPFGAGNPQPILGLFNMTVKAIQPISNGKHIKISFVRDDAVVSAMYFGMSPEKFGFAIGDVVDLAVCLDRNEYLNNITVGIYIKNIRLAKMDETQILKGIRIYEKYMRNEELNKDEAAIALPNREFMGTLYRTIKNNSGWNGEKTVLCRKIGDNGEKYCAMRFALDAFKELGLIVENDGCIELSPTSKKVNLDDSIILNRIKRCL